MTGSTSELLSRARTYIVAVGLEPTTTAATSDDDEDDFGGDDDDGTKWDTFSWAAIEWVQ